MPAHPFEQLPPVPPIARVWTIVIVLAALGCAWLTVSAAILEAMTRSGVMS